MRRGRTLAMVLSLAIAAGSAPARAQLYTALLPTHRVSQSQAADYSRHLQTELAAQGVKVALVFRYGMPPRSLPDGLSYTHGAFFVRQEGGTYRVYNLYQGDGRTLPRTRSSLVQDTPDVFYRGAVEDHVAVIVPNPATQQRLAEVIGSPAYQALHNPSYALTANPFADRHQNCNTFMLRVLVAAAWRTSDPVKISDIIKTRFRGSDVRVNAVERFFAPIIDKRIALDDQHGTIVTASYESIVAFMQANGLMDTTYVFDARGLGETADSR